MRGIIPRDVSLRKVLRASAAVQLICDRKSVSTALIVARALALDFAARAREDGPHAILFL